MEPDAPKNIGRLLPWGVALFAVMHFGCGAHMMGEYVHHGECHHL